MLSRQSTCEPHPEKHPPLGNRCFNGGAEIETALYGRTPLAVNVLKAVLGANQLGFGHQHLGLTGAPKTGRWLAQMIAGNAPNVDMAQYSPDRF